MADADGWNGPRRHGEDGVTRLVNEMKKLDQRLSAVERGAPLRSAGISVTEDGMVVDRSLAVTGDLDVTGDAEFSGDTTIGGNASITGTLSLPNGIIDNDALTSPMTQDSGFGNSAAFAIPNASGNTLALFTVEVPAGYTKASYILEGAGGVRNLGATDTFAYLRCFSQYPSGAYNWGSRTNVQIAPTTVRTTSALLVRSVDEPLSGGQLLSFFVEIYADTAQAADASNFASCAALVTFTR